VFNSAGACSIQWNCSSSNPIGGTGGGTAWSRDFSRGEAKREDVVRIVRARFGQAPKALEERLACADEAALDELLVRAATVDSADAS